MNEFQEYNKYLEILISEIGDFLNLAHKGRTVPYTALKARKKSIYLRKLLKEFRNISIKNDKGISEIVKNSKIKIFEEINKNGD